MQTTYDPLIPPIFGEVNFENMIEKQGKMKYLTVKYTNGQGQCSFTPVQNGIAFDEPRAWAGGGKEGAGRLH